ncbi:polysaccharide deacetylase family protein [Aquibacillus salsiterrae]|uniref:Polysaccharide deacetylase family protein n=1 Tax=Aquibacillus salsiterrae TaxID=2950439 RepID=A0A9X3WCU1_9BACI|nr:polysaccharide deacetylase family protein [Aquibacillus salsiterrae]MDC3416046.1 polysaccharide deacetylase family protein [Aquibacillus salsiterrae]
MNDDLGIITKVDTEAKMVAFTFDDGPNPTYTRELLDIFNEVSGHATFFMIGEQMERHPEVVGEVPKQGHEIGNHTFTHAKLTELTDEQCFVELDKTAKLIKELTGDVPKHFRPPFIDYNRATKKVVERFGYDTIGALNVDALDWEQPGIEHIYTKSLNHVASGSILIFHDGFGDRSQSIEAVRRLVKELTSQGYQLVTVSKLLNQR